LQFAGEWLAAAWALPAVFGLRPQDLGEILFAALVAVATLCALAASLVRERGAALAPSIVVTALLAMLAVFGVLVDALHVIAYFAESRWSWVLAVVEDGGELVVMSAIVAYTWWLAALQARPPVLEQTVVLGGDVLSRYAFDARGTRP